MIETVFALNLTIEWWNNFFSKMRKDNVQIKKKMVRSKSCEIGLILKSDKGKLY